LTWPLKTASRRRGDSALEMKILLKNNPIERAKARLLRDVLPPLSLQLGDAPLAPIAEDAPLDVDATQLPLPGGDFPNGGDRDGTASSSSYWPHVPERSSVTGGTRPRQPSTVSTRFQGYATSSSLSETSRSREVRDSRSGSVNMSGVTSSVASLVSYTGSLPTSGMDFVSSPTASTGYLETTSTSGHDSLRGSESENDSFAGAEEEEHLGVDHASQSLVVHYGQSGSSNPRRAFVERPFEGVLEDFSHC